MNTPTDPLPEPWEWYNYQEEAWAAYNSARRSYLAWTFQPVVGRSRMRMGGYEQLDKTNWVVKSQYNKEEEGAYDAVFATREEATRYISARAMLGTFEEPK